MSNLQRVGSPLAGFALVAARWAPKAGCTGRFRPGVMTSHPHQCYLWEERVQVTDPVPRA